MCLQATVEYKFEEVFEEYPFIGDDSFAIHMQQQEEQPREGRVNNRTHKMLYAGGAGGAPAAMRLKAEPF